MSVFFLTTGTTGEVQSVGSIDFCITTSFPKRISFFIHLRKKRRWNSSRHRCTVRNRAIFKCDFHMITCHFSIILIFPQLLLFTFHRLCWVTINFPRVQKNRVLYMQWGKRLLFSNIIITKHFLLRNYIYKYNNFDYYFLVLPYFSATTIEYLKVKLA